MTRAKRSRCEPCEAKFTGVPHARREAPKRASSARRGYDSKWRRLSERARQLQPFCTDCGSLHDLQADHTPEAWARHDKGLAVRLEDIEVVCGECNRARGDVRGSRATRRVGGQPEEGDVRLNGG